MAVDYGTDLDWSTDIPARFSYATGPRNLGNALVRRLSTARGALAAVDPAAADYGLDVRALLFGSGTLQQLRQTELDIVQECQKDERVRACAAAISFNFTTGAAIINLTIYTDDTAAPFSFIVQVTALTVTLLETP
jgi:hypothetical protein